MSYSVVCMCVCSSIVSVCLRVIIKMFITLSLTSFLSRLDVLYIRLLYREHSQRVAGSLPTADYLIPIASSLALYHIPLQLAT